MPRDGTGVYTYPAGTPGAPDTTIESAKYNAYIADMQNDANNARPIIAGGTGASTVTDARNNLGAMPIGGGAMTGNLSVTPPAGSASLTLTKAASGSNTYIQTYTAANLRWQLHLGEGTAETGANAGSDFALNRYSDAGTYLGQPLAINRGSGAITLNGSVSINGPLSVTGVNTLNGATTITGGLSTTGTVTHTEGDTWLQRAGSPSTGLLHFGNSGVKYIFYDTNYFQFIGAPIRATGGIHSDAYMNCTTSASVGSSLAVGTSASVGSSLTVGTTINGAGHCTFGNVTAQGGVVYLNAANSRYIQYSSEVLNYSGWAILHAGNYTSYIPAPVTAVRMAYGTDYNFGLATGLVEPLSGTGACTGGAGLFGNAYTLRFRYVQYQINGGWVTAGTA